MRPGQLSIWLVLSAILILVMALLYFRVSVTEKLMAESSKVSQQWDVSAISGLVQSCLNKAASESLFYFGMVGDSRGPSGLPNDFFSGNYFVYDGQYKIPYYFKDGAVLMPSPAQASAVMGAYVDAKVPACTKGFSEVRGFEITQTPPQTRVLINEKTVDFLMVYPLKLTRGPQSTILDEFSFRIPSRLNQILTIAKIIVDHEVKDDAIVYWDFLTDVTRLGFNMTAHAERENTIIYRLVDSAFPIYFEPFVFQFANRVEVEG